MVDSADGIPHGLTVALRPVVGIMLTKLDLDPDTLATHPEYQRQGAGSTPVKWGFANKDGGVC